MRIEVATHAENVFPFEIASVRIELTELELIWEEVAIAVDVI